MDTKEDCKSEVSILSPNSYVIFCNIPFLFSFFVNTYTLLQFFP